MAERASAARRTLTLRRGKRVPVATNVIAGMNGKTGVVLSSEWNPQGVEEVVVSVKRGDNRPHRARFAASELEVLA